MKSKIKKDKSKLIGVRDHLVSWVLVNDLGKLRFSKSSYYYIIIVPIIVKVLEKVESPIILKFGESNIPISVDLPFSWYYFYFGALAIAVGSLIYQIYCPKLIKDFKNYGEFLTAGESDNYLHAVSSRYKISSFYWSPLDPPYLEEKAKVKTAGFGIIEPGFFEYEKVVGYKHNVKYQEERKNAFNLLYNEVKYIKIGIIYTSSILYLAGFSAFVGVIIQNIYFVLNHWLNL